MLAGESIKGDAILLNYLDYTDSCAFHGEVVKSPQTGETFHGYISLLGRGMYYIPESMKVVKVGNIEPRLLALLGLYNEYY